MRTTNQSARILSALILSVACAQVRAASFTNGSFELPLVATNSIRYFNNGDSGLTGWSVGGIQGTVSLVNGFVPQTIGPADGAQWLILNAGMNPTGNGISQTFDTQTGRTYSVSFRVGKVGVAPGNMEVTATVTGDGGIVLGTLAATQSTTGWGPSRAFTFTATSATSVLTLVDTSSTTIDTDAALDNVTVEAIKVLDFEPPLPSGLVAATHAHLAQVPASALITTQYASAGVVMRGVALVTLSTAAPSGVNGLGGVNAQGQFDSGSPMTFTFVSPADGTTPATTDFVSITPDNLNDSDNSTVVSAYGLDGSLLGTALYQETGQIVPVKPIILQNIGRIHRVVVAPTLHESAGGWGGIQFDLLSFAPVRPEPVLSIRVSQVELSFLTELNKWYQLQYRSDLTTNQWVNLGDLLLGTGSKISVADDVAENHRRFYRLSVVP